MSGHEFTMSLGVRHPDIDPAEISHALGMQPGHVWRRGDQRLDEAGAAVGGTHHASYWMCEITPRPAFPGERIAMESELNRVLLMLRRSFSFLQGLHFGGGAIELRISIYTRGDFRMELAPEDGAMLGRMGIATTIEIKQYPVAMTAAAS